MKKKLAKLIWLTGLSGSGKSTLADKIFTRLKNFGFEAKKIDGDIFRKKSKNKNNFTKKNIIDNHKKILQYIEKIENKFDYIIIAVISPLLVTKEKSKKKFGERYYEIYVKCSIKELFRRDTKGLYKKAKEKKITNLIGYTSTVKFERTRYKKIIVDTEKLTISKSTNLIIKKILNK